MNEKCDITDKLSKVSLGLDRLREENKALSKEKHVLKEKRSRSADHVERLTVEIEERIKAECQERFNQVFRSWREDIVARAREDARKASAVFEESIDRLRAENRSLAARVKEMGAQQEQERAQHHSELTQLQEALKRSAVATKSTEAQLALADRKLRDLTRAALSPSGREPTAALLRAPSDAAARRRSAALPQTSTDAVGTEARRSAAPPEVPAVNTRNRRGAVLSAAPSEVVQRRRSAVLPAAPSEVAQRRRSAMVPELRVQAASTEDLPSRRDELEFKQPAALRPKSSSHGDVWARPSSSVERQPPPGTGAFFSCVDEEGEVFSSSFLKGLEEGQCNVDPIGRLSELQRRNSLMLPHLRSAYAPELHYTSVAEKVTEESLRNGDAVVTALSERTRRFTLDSPASNTRSKRKSADSSDLLSDSLDSNSSSSSLNSKRRRRDHLQTSYARARPGNLTPAKSVKPTEEGGSFSVSLGSISSQDLLPAACVPTQDESLSGRTPSKRTGGGRTPSLKKLLRRARGKENRPDTGKLLKEAKK